MRHRGSKVVLGAALVLGGGYAFANNGGGCVSLGGDAVLGSVDFCFLFDCVNGAIGGLLQPCDNVGSINTLFDNRDTINGVVVGNQVGTLFTDCVPNGNP